MTHKIFVVFLLAHQFDNEKLQSIAVIVLIDAQIFPSLFSVRLTRLLLSPLDKASIIVDSFLAFCPNSSCVFYT